MPQNNDTSAPTFVEITFDTDYTPRTLRGVDIFADGDLSFVDIEDNTFVRTFANTDLPYRFEGQIKRINSTNTTISAANLLGLR